jgi:hypothetical protein
LKRLFGLDQKLGCDFSRQNIPIADSAAEHWLCGNDPSYRTSARAWKQLHFEIVRRPHWRLDHEVNVPNFDSRSDWPDEFDPTAEPRKRNLVGLDDDDLLAAIEPSKTEPELDLSGLTQKQRDFVNALTADHKIPAACRFAGVDATTGRRWLKRMVILDHKVMFAKNARLVHERKSAGALLTPRGLSAGEGAVGASSPAPYQELKARNVA